MDLILFLFVFYVIIRFCYGLGKHIDRNVKKEGMRYRIIGLVVALLILFGDIPIRYLQFEYLCHWRHYPPLEINKDVAGYVNLGEGKGCDESCEQALLETGNAIVEVNVLEESVQYLSERKGWHSYYLTNKDDPECNLFYERGGLLNDKYQIPKNQCIAADSLYGRHFEVKGYENALYIKLVEEGYFPFFYDVKEYVSLSRKASKITEISQKVQMEGWWVPNLVLYEEIFPWVYYTDELAY